MYGFKPKANTEKLAKVPPEKISKSDRRGLPEKSAVSVVLSIPEAGMWAHNLKTTRIIAEMIIFLLTDGVFQTLLKNCKVKLNILLRIIS